MTKIVKSIWVNTMQGCIGIVLIDNGFVTKAYIKQVEGIDEDFDSNDVAQNGGKFTLHMAEEIIKHLKN